MTDFLINIVYAIFGLGALYYGADFLVKGGVSIAKKCGVSSLVIGLTLVACATSAPELVVSVSAAMDSNADISLGNIVGSNICNIALILGVCACITPMAVHRQLLRFDVPVMIAAVLLLSVFYMSENGINRFHGMVMLALFIAYTWYCIYLSRKENAYKKNKKNKKKENKTNTISKEAGTMPLGRSLFLVAAGFALLIAGAKTFLWSSVYFARLLNLSDAVIGLTVVAVGTSLPELATSVVAAFKKEDDIAIGNVLGSNIFNILGVLGITPLISPLSNATLNLVDFGVMLFCSIAMVPVMRSGWKISRREGLFFLMVYVAYTRYLIHHHT